MVATDLPLSQHSLEFLIQGCRQESQSNWAEEAGYCFELFLRALVHKDDKAWQAIQVQYDRLVLKWLRAKVAENAAGLEDLRQETWARFWRTLNGKSETIAARFEHVGALLNYLNRCSLAAFVDEQRRQRKQELIQEKLRDVVPMNADGETYLEKMERKELLSRVKAWITTEVDDVQEKLVLYLSYERGLTPMEIASQHPEHFTDAKTVRRVKERVLKRARYTLS